MAGKATAELVGPIGDALGDLDGPTLAGVQTEAEAGESVEAGARKRTLVARRRKAIALVDHRIDTPLMIDALEVIALEEAGQEAGRELTGKPCVLAEQSAVGRIEHGGDAIGMLAIVEVEGLAGEGTHHPMEEVVVRLEATVAVLAKLGYEAIGIPRTTDQPEVEDVEERIGYQRIARTRAALAGIRTADVDPSLVGCLTCKGKYGIEIGQEAILVDVDGNVARLVLEHPEEVAIGRLVGKAYAGIASIFVQTTAQEVQLLVERAAEELYSKFQLSVNN